MASDWNGIDIEAGLNDFLSSILKDAGIEVCEEVSMDMPLELDYAELLNRLEAHLDFVVKISNETLDAMD